VKRQPSNPLNKPVLDQPVLDQPVLDQGSFQKLLAAAYILQEQNDHLPVNEAKEDFSHTPSEGPVAKKAHPPVSLTAEPPQPRPPQPILSVQRRAPSAANGSRHRTMRARTSPSNELFWRTATIAAMAAVSALLLVASIDRFSPLPARLAPPSEAVQRQVPFTQSAVTVLAQSSGVGARTVVMEPHAATNTGPDEPAVVDDQPPETSLPLPQLRGR
jgi:hypothetical protein